MQTQSMSTIGWQVQHWQQLYESYKKAKAKKIQWFKKISSSLPSFDTKLPAAEVEIWV